MSKIGTMYTTTHKKSKDVSDSEPYLHMYSLQLMTSELRNDTSTENQVTFISYYDSIKACIIDARIIILVVGSNYDEFKELHQKIRTLFDAFHIDSHGVMIVYYDNSTPTSDSYDRFVAKEYCMIRIHGSFSEIYHKYPFLTRNCDIILSDFSTNALFPCGFPVILSLLLTPLTGTAILHGLSRRIASVRPDVCFPDIVSTTCNQDTEYYEELFHLSRTTIYPNVCTEQKSTCLWQLTQPNSCHPLR